MGDPDIEGTVLRLPFVYGTGDYQHRIFEFLERMDDKRPAILLDQKRGRRVLQVQRHQANPHIAFSDQPRDLRGKFVKAASVRADHEFAQNLMQHDLER